MSNVSLLTIQPESQFQIGLFNVDIMEHLGQFCDIHYYRVMFSKLATEESPESGLLRVGSPLGKLADECRLRATLGSHQMILPILAEEKIPAVCLWSKANEQEQTAKTETENLEDNNPSEEDIYLPDDYAEVPAENSSDSQEKLILLTSLPAPEKTLEFWLNSSPNLPDILLISSQICQFFRYIYQNQWCVISLLPDYVKMGNPLQFIDLTSAYPLGSDSNFVSKYSAPELFCDSRCVDEFMSTYSVGIIIYQAIHQKLPPSAENLTNLSDNLDIDIQKIPKIYQILKIALSPVSDERFTLSQLLSLLVKTRQSLQTSQTQWEVADRTTLGLSPNRLQNEDSHGYYFNQPSPNNSQSILLGIVADGMGGMAQGEVASKIAVETILNLPVDRQLSTPQERANWLIFATNTANQAVNAQVKEGGTTLSVILAVDRELNIAHIGDSRIYLLRNHQLCQLSEDHSYVAMLLASGQISYEESLCYPDRSVLTKSLGAKSSLSQGYIQDLSRYYENLSLKLENNDILILCSDGVWDLVSANELADIFETQVSLKEAVNQSIETVLQRGAHDNATILAFKCHIKAFQL